MKILLILFRFVFLLCLGLAALAYGSLQLVTAIDAFVVDLANHHLGAMTILIACLVLVLGILGVGVGIYTVAYALGLKLRFPTRFNR